MTHGRQLTDKQLIILSAASQRHDHLLSLPDNLRGGAARALVSRLVARGLVEEVTVGSADPHWRTSEDGTLTGLRITAAGLQAIGVEPNPSPSNTSQDGSNDDHPAPAQKPAAAPGTGPKREGTKRALVIALLSREQGASLDDLTTATGWLPHTTRAALTGLRQSGYAITRTRAGDNRTLYRLASLVETASVQATPEPAEV
jgi:hypothetical protein